MFTDCERLSPKMYCCWVINYILWRHHMIFMVPFCFDCCRIATNFAKFIQVNFAESSFKCELWRHFLLFWWLSTQKCMEVRLLTLHKVFLLISSTTCLFREMNNWNVTCVKEINLVMKICRSVRYSTVGWILIFPKLMSIFQNRIT